MAKTVHNDVLDAALDKIATCTEYNVCSAQPTTRVEAITTYSLANAVLVAGDGGGDYVIADGDADGRKVTISEQLAIVIDASGTALFIALSDGVNLLYVTTCTSQELTAAGTVDFPAWDAELADPV